MFISLDFESKDPIYLQLSQQIIEGIARRQLCPGDTLPSVRSLAADIGINLHTVNKAYQQLKQDGFLHIHRQKGVVINPDGVPKADDQYRSKVEHELHPIIAENICRDLNKEEFLNMCSHIYSEFTKDGES
ncbi:MAG: GntR family transcriptional regulator [Bacillota bacterium]|uniref:GntR family transcriptional regulator n=1 Tax=Virgibacillus salarius TaxID=447199 RepID=A0A941DU99_9BACI|nr:MULTISPECIES: GntR family transcriptional regulator [Bacillaceae]MBR7795254.1 GntR family transcriptional regulator [Virgibacillus salarius]NAZ07970.1 GntR family transcriptional regulator [Agaribacter marinus]MCC2251523.1 GntR family transcriptional regulator [Virgibacillus sp. AGTR]MDY7045369.1 GntR family transcriptional regulator [Virgibacillus sp. M23]QRZ19969.1 GntR family transcriptional regulator [Virgibacillus sp. AGTR]